MIRRDFLSLSALTAGSLLLDPWTRAFAQNAQRARNNLILICLEGGWDITLGIAPLTHADWGTDQQDVFIEYREDERLRAGNLFLGPAAAPLLPFASRFSLVNGIFLSRNDPGHDSAATYMRTGDGTGAKPDLPVDVASKDADTGLGVLFNSRLSRGTAKVLSLQLREMDRLVELGRTGLSPGDCTNPPTDFLRARCELQSKKQQLETYDTIFKSLHPAPVTDDSEADPARIASVLGSGLSRFVRWDIFEGFDTHINHAGTHLAAQTKAWQKVAVLFDALNKVPVGQGNLFDVTTVMVVSEFSRTPALNPSGGKDHNPMLNGVLLAGAGLRGGQDFGRGRVIPRKLNPSGLPAAVGLPVDFKTGEVALSRTQAADPRFRFITPDIVTETVRQAIGVPADTKKVIPALLS